jgi:hypothetical protein
VLIVVLLRTKVLQAHHWNRKQAAGLLKIDYKALLYKMKKLGVESDGVALTGEAGGTTSTMVAAAG